MLNRRNSGHVTVCNSLRNTCRGLNVLDFSAPQQNHRETSFDRARVPWTVLLTFWLFVLQKAGWASVSFETAVFQLQQKQSQQQWIILKHQSCTGKLNQSINLSITLSINSRLFNRDRLTQRQLGYCYELLQFTVATCVSKHIIYYRMYFYMNIRLQFLYE